MEGVANGRGRRTVRTEDCVIRFIRRPCRPCRARRRVHAGGPPPTPDSKVGLMPRVTIGHRHNASAGAIGALALTQMAPDHVITAVRDGSGNLKVIAWQVGSDGSLTRRGD